MEFSKKLIIFASVMYAMTWVVVVSAFFFAKEPPWGLLETLSWVYGAAVCCYCGKSAYENKSKIQYGYRGKDGTSNEHGG